MGFNSGFKGLSEVFVCFFWSTSLTPESFPKYRTTIKYCLLYNRWHAVVLLVEALHYKPKGGGFDSHSCHWNFSWTIPFRPHFAPGVDSECNSFEYQEYFLGGKGDRCLRLTTLPPSCTVCLENFEPQPPGTLWACNWLVQGLICLFIL